MFTWEPGRVDCRDETNNGIPIRYTVEPRYLELAYLELPAISNINPFPLDLPIKRQAFLLGYLELV